VHETIRLLTNSADVPLFVWIEPWAEEIQIPTGHTYKFVGSGTEKGELEVENRDHVAIVYGWPTSTLTVFDGDTTIWETDNPVPPVPSGVSVKSFVKQLFHSPRNEEASE